LALRQWVPHAKVIVENYLHQMLQKLGVPRRIDLIKLPVSIQA